MGMNKGKSNKISLTQLNGRLTKQPGGAAAQLNTSNTTSNATDNNDTNPLNRDLVQLDPSSGNVKIEIGAQNHTLLIAFDQLKVTFDLDEQFGIEEDNKYDAKERKAAEPLFLPAPERFYPASWNATPKEFRGPCAQSPHCVSMTRNCEPILNLFECNQCLEPDFGIVLEAPTNKTEGQCGLCLPYPNRDECDIQSNKFCFMELKSKEIPVDENYKQIVDDSTSSQVPVKGEIKGNNFFSFSDYFPQTIHALSQFTGIGDNDQKSVLVFEKKPYFQCTKCKLGFNRTAEGKCVAESPVKRALVTVGKIAGGFCSRDPDCEFFGKECKSEDIQWPCEICGCEKPVFNEKTKLCDRDGELYRESREEILDGKGWSSQYSLVLTKQQASMEEKSDGDYWPEVLEALNIPQISKELPDWPRLDGLDLIFHESFWEKATKLKQKIDKSLGGVNLDDQVVLHTCDDMSRHLTGPLLNATAEEEDDDENAAFLQLQESRTSTRDSSTGSKDEESTKELLSQKMKKIPAPTTVTANHVGLSLKVDLKHANLQDAEAEASGLLREKETTQLRKNRKYDPKADPSLNNNNTGVTQPDKTRQSLQDRISLHEALAYKPQCGPVSKNFNFTKKMRVNAQVTVSLRFWALFWDRPGEAFIKFNNETVATDTTNGFACGRGQKHISSWQPYVGRSPGTGICLITMRAKVKKQNHQDFRITVGSKNVSQPFAFDDVRIVYDAADPGEVNPPECAQFNDSNWAVNFTPAANGFYGQKGLNYTETADYKITGEDADLQTTVDEEFDEFKSLENWLRTPEGRAYLGTTADGLAIARAIKAKYHILESLASAVESDMISNETAMKIEQKYLEEFSLLKDLPEVVKKLEEKAKEEDLIAPKMSKETYEVNVNQEENKIPNIPVSNVPFLIRKIVRTLRKMKNKATNRHVEDNIVDEALDTLYNSDGGIAADETSSDAAYADEESSSSTSSFEGTDEYGMNYPSVVREAKLLPETSMTEQQFALTAEKRLQLENELAHQEELRKQEWFWPFTSSSNSADEIPPDEIFTNETVTFDMPLGPKTTPPFISTVAWTDRLPGYLPPGGEIVGYEPDGTWYLDFLGAKKHCEELEYCGGVMSHGLGWYWTLKTAEHLAKDSRPIGGSKSPFFTYLIPGRIVQNGGYQQCPEEELRNCVLSSCLKKQYSNWLYDNLFFFFPSATELAAAGYIPHHTNVIKSIPSLPGRPNLTMPGFTMPNVSMSMPGMPGFPAMPNVSLPGMPLPSASSMNFTSYFPTIRLPNGTYWKSKVPIPAIRINSSYWLNAYNAFPNARLGNGSSNGSNTSASSSAWSYLRDFFAQNNLSAKEVEEQMGIDINNLANNGSEAVAENLSSFVLPPPTNDSDFYSNESAALFPFANNNTTFTDFYPHQNQEILVEDSATDADLIPPPTTQNYCRLCEPHYGLLRDPEQLALVGRCVPCNPANPGCKVPSDRECVTGVNKTLLQLTMVKYQYKCLQCESGYQLDQDTQQCRVSTSSELIISDPVGKTGQQPVAHDLWLTGSEGIAPAVTFIVCQKDPNCQLFADNCNKTRLWPCLQCGPSAPVMDNKLCRKKKSLLDERGTELVGIGWSSNSTVYSGTANLRTCKKVEYYNYKNYSISNFEESIIPSGDLMSNANFSMGGGNSSSNASKKSSTKDSVAAVTLPQLARELFHLRQDDPSVPNLLNPQPGLDMLGKRCDAIKKTMNLEELGLHRSGYIKISVEVWTLFWSPHDSLQGTASVKREERVWLKANGVELDGVTINDGNCRRTDVGFLGTTGENFDSDGDDFSSYASALKDATGSSGDKNDTSASLQPDPVTLIQQFPATASAAYRMRRSRPLATFAGWPAESAYYLDDKKHGGPVCVGILTGYAFYKYPNNMEVEIGVSQPDRLNFALDQFHVDYDADQQDLWKNASLGIPEAIVRVAELEAKEQGVAVQEVLQGIDGLTSNETNTTNETNETGSTSLFNGTTDAAATLFPLPTLAFSTYTQLWSAFFDMFYRKNATGNLTVDGKIVVANKSTGNVAITDWNYTWNESSSTRRTGDGYSYNSNTAPGMTKGNNSALNTTSGVPVNQFSPNFGYNPFEQQLLLLQKAQRAASQVLSTSHEDQQEHSKVYSDNSLSRTSTSTTAGRKAKDQNVRENRKLQKKKENGNLHPVIGALTSAQQALDKLTRQREDTIKHRRALDAGDDYGEDGKKSSAAENRGSGSTEIEKWLKDGEDLDQEKKSVVPTIAGPAAVDSSGSAILNRSKAAAQRNGKETTPGQLVDGHEAGDRTPPVVDESKKPVLIGAKREVEEFISGNSKQRDGPSSEIASAADKAPASSSSSLWSGVTDLLGLNAGGPPPPPAGAEAPAGSGTSSEEEKKGSSSATTSTGLLGTSSVSPSSTENRADQISSSASSTTTGEESRSHVDLLSGTLPPGGIDIKLPADYMKKDARGPAAPARAEVNTQQHDEDQAQEQSKKTAGKNKSEDEEEDHRMLTSTTRAVKDVKDTRKEQDHFFPSQKEKEEVEKLEDKIPAERKAEILRTLTRERIEDQTRTSGANLSGDHGKRAQLKGKRHQNERERSSFVQDAVASSSSTSTSVVFRSKDENNYSKQQEDPRPHHPQNGEEQTSSDDNSIKENKEQVDDHGSTTASDSSAPSQHQEDFPHSALFRAFAPIEALVPVPRVIEKTDEEVDHEQAPGRRGKIDSPTTTTSEEEQSKAGEKEGSSNYSSTGGAQDLSLLQKKTTAFAHEQEARKNVALAKKTATTLTHVQEGQRHPLFGSTLIDDANKPNEHNKHERNNAAAEGASGPSQSHVPLTSHGHVGLSTQPENSANVDPGHQRLLTRLKHLENDVDKKRSEKDKGR
ncbi:unnamed protein product [Amoebophrya sp. A120]|nr:unnamed protein product [Amoebophrya sp. A120]|eukprot:GSA120T00023507001.1